MSFGTFPPSVYREYALFLEEVAKDMTGAEKHYVLACKDAPEDASFLVSLAVFRGESRGRIKDAERVFEQVMKNTLESYVVIRSQEGERRLSHDYRHCAWSRITAALYPSSSIATSTFYGKA